MNVRLWAVNALTGAVVSELPAMSGSFTSRFGGGTCDLTVPLGNLKRRDSSEVDWPAVARVIDVLSTGRRTVVLTAGTNVLGEWLLMERPEVIGEGLLAVQGMEWDGYPALRSLHASYEYKTATEQLAIAKTLLLDAFQGWQEAFQITVPTSSSGVKRTGKWRTREGYYSDALDEISQPEDGFDWRVGHTGSWSGGSLTKVNRTVRFGSPEIKQSSSIVVRHDGPGTRSGNCLSFEQTIDSRNYLHSVYAWGAGDGAKQLFYEKADDTLATQGHVKITKNLSYPNIIRQAALAALASAELKAGQNLRNPAKAVLVADKLPALPKLGDLITAQIAPTWTIPAGYNGTMRVGEVRLPVTAGMLDTVEVGAI
ncbi:hypothetical protein U6G28_02660 [Actinomycetaceae bacterium MB13-C1-2]|nr:hypothetical protein U6G28_02660 [Actinomycetaceae bacterium MB13-C1-2]